MPQKSWTQDLIDRGIARPLNEKEKAQVQAFEKAVEEKVIPAIIEAQAEQRRLVHNMRVRPFARRSR